MVKLGELNRDICLVCGKGIQQINGYWLHLEPSDPNEKAHQIEPYRDIEKREQIRLCNNCDWVGWESECVAPKHWLEDRLCPECNETTDVLLPHDYIALRERVRKNAN